MEDDDRPTSLGGVRSDAARIAASTLASESLERYSLDELDLRIALLEAEIVRTRNHRAHATASRMAAEALFAAKPKAPDRP
jgi:uncharacterized small protein (DUF1192 family)